MASEVDICNASLAQLGDAAMVTSISPPDGSVQASLCARFYPQVRDSLLERHAWGFATRRALLADLSSDVAQWAYRYAAPAEMLCAFAVLDHQAPADVLPSVSEADGWPVLFPARPAPRPFVVEAMADGSRVIYTNQAHALLRYTARVTDTTKFSPLFVEALCAALSASLAGPLLRGDSGIRAAATWRTTAFGPDGNGGLFARAAASDAKQQFNQTRMGQPVAWLADR